MTHTQAEEYRRQGRVEQSQAFVMAGVVTVFLCAITVAAFHSLASNKGVGM